MTPEPHAPEGEQAGLPAWLYPAGFWAALGLCLLATLLPRLALLAVSWLLAVPVLAALWVLVTGWRRDRRLSLAALAALLALALVLVLKQLL